MNYLIISFNAGTGEKNNLATSTFIDRFPGKQFTERTKYTERESLMKYTKKGIYIFLNQAFNLLVWQSVLFPRKFAFRLQGEEF